MPYQRTEIARPKGINRDLSPYELPPDVWSDGRNVNFRNLRTNKSLGYENPYTLSNTVVSPIFALYYTDNINPFWLYASEGEIYITDGVTATLVGSGYTATRDLNWTGINFNGLITLNNVNDHPVQLMAPYTTSEPLENWGSYKDPLGDTVNNTAPWGALSRASVIRGYKNYLFALNNYDENDTHYPLMVRWSSPAESGSAPASWEPFNVDGGQAGLYSLADTLGAVIDGLTLGDYFVIYKSDAVWLVQFIGGEVVFSFRKLFGDEAGILAADCVAEFDGKHFVLSPNGAYVHNGATKQEVMDPWVKDEFFNTVEPTLLLNTKIVADHSNKEIWVYYTTLIDSEVTARSRGPAKKRDAATQAANTLNWANRALIWNWEIGEWTIRDLSGISYIAEGIIDSAPTAGVDTWDADSQAWDDDITIWNNNTNSPYNDTLKALLLTDYTNKLLYAEGFANTQVGLPLTGFVERIAIDFGDDNSYKYVTRITPHFLGANSIQVKVLASDVYEKEPTIQAIADFNPEQEHDIDCHITGRYIGLRFEGSGEWECTGYTIQWEPAGVY